MNVSSVAVGCDHAGYIYKAAVIDELSAHGVVVLDYGTNGPDSVDYPDFVHPTCTAIEKGEADLGIVMCGSGNGVAMTANKHDGIRAALCWNNELTALARQHNNANVLALPTRFISEHQARNMVRIFIKTAFEGGRHDRRVNKIPCSV